MDVIEWAADLLVDMKTEKKKEKKKKKKSLAPAKTPTDGTKRSVVNHMIDVAYRVLIGPRMLD